MDAGGAMNGTTNGPTPPPHLVSFAASLEAVFGQLHPEKKVAVNLVNLDRLDAGGNPRLADEHPGAMGDDGDAIREGDAATLANRADDDSLDQTRQRLTAAV